jgi:hypothetical protein
MSEPKHNANAGGNGAAPAIPDATDIEALWLNPALGDGIVDVTYHTVPVGKPRDFFRTVIDPAYRRRTEIYVHKPEGMIDEVSYIIAPAMLGRIQEARPCTLVTVVHRDGSPRLWPIKFPKDGERDNDAWMSARAAAKIGMERWTKLIWVRRSYQTRCVAGLRAGSGFLQAAGFQRVGTARFRRCRHHPGHRAPDLSRAVWDAERSRRRCRRSR